MVFSTKEYRIVDDEEDKSKKLTAIDVLEEIQPLLLANYNLEELRAKPEVKKYAFELADIPKEAEYLKGFAPIQ